ncbi:MAG: hypothetical protein HLX50_03100, partial [Alteromonadaceae bacterium]|nr:hypothetical protein [Alteromonadaceae bacterium]
MSGSNNQLGVMTEYLETAFRSDNIPKQQGLENPGGFVKSLEGSDLIERLAWAHYSDLNIHLRPKYMEAYQAQELSGKRLPEGRAWTHKHKPKDLIKTRWQLLLMLAGAFADYSIFGFFFVCNLLAAIIVGVLDGWAAFTSFFEIAAWMIGLHLFFRY